MHTKGNIARLHQSRKKRGRSLIGTDEYVEKKDNEQILKAAINEKDNFIENMKIYREKKNNWKEKPQMQRSPEKQQNQQQKRHGDS